MEILLKTRKTEGKANKNLLSEGVIPGVVYGHGYESTKVQISRKDFYSIFNTAGESSLIVAKIDDKELGSVLIKDCQVDPVSGDIIHFDLHKVRMDEKIIANVEVILVGESPAVKDLGGVLVVGCDELEIRCYPGDLLSEVSVDISGLKNFDDMIRVSDLNLAKNIEILNTPEDVLVSVEPPRSNEEMEQLDDKPEENVEKVVGAVKEEVEEVKKDK